MTSCRVWFRASCHYVVPFSLLFRKIGEMSQRGLECARLLQPS